MIETSAWKKMRGLVECDKCRLCGEHRETVPPPLVWVQTASRNRVCQMTQQYFESVSSKMGSRKWTAP